MWQKHHCEHINLLRVILNIDGTGWNAPRQSHKLVHPKGVGSRSSNKDMYISLEPSPDYSGIAKAAAGVNFGSLKGGLYAAKASTTEELKEVLDKAVKEVISGRGAVVEVVLNVDEQGNFLTHSK